MGRGCVVKWGWSEMEGNEVEGGGELEGRGEMEGGVSWRVWGEM